MAATDLLTTDAVRLGLSATDRFEAVRLAGEILLDIGAIQPPYVDAMREREEIISSYVGEGFAIPHGTDESRAHVNRAAFAFLQFPDGIDWDGDDVRACIAIASKGDEHVSVLATLAELLLDGPRAERLRTTDDPEEVVELLRPAEDEEKDES